VGGCHLREAKKLGDELVVVAKDPTMKKAKTRTSGDEKKKVESIKL
jgi:glycerol-3-phosphate cytidylyltransferase-like family protein